MTSFSRCAASGARLGDSVKSVSPHRDADGFLDHDETDAGTDPADRTSTPGGPALPLDRVLVGTSSLRMTGRSGRTAARFTFASRTQKDPAPNRIVPPPRDGTLDPTLHGAMLYVSNARFTSEVVAYPLPAAGWRRVGSEAKPKGYRFRAAPAGGGTLQKVVLRNDTIRIGGTIPYSLDESAQGSIAVRLVPGLFSDAGWCTTVAARRQGARGSTAKNDHVGRFVGAKKTPAPAACPPLP
jgi:hypothetical protein